MSLFATIAALWVPPEEVRAETWSMGVLHRGEVVQGARAELRTPGLPMRRAILLRAVIRRARLSARDLARQAARKPAQ